MFDLQPAIVQSEYHDVLQTLQRLTRQHAQTYRLGVGAYILQRFFGGSAAEFSNSAPNKDAKFADFVQAHAAELDELDLSETTLRRFVRAHIGFSLLPPGLGEQLGWSALLEICKIEDVNQRARLAMATVREQWPVAKVREAVALVRQHRLWDAEPDQAGLQLPAPKPAPPVQPGRLVTRTEKWVEEVAAWQAEFGQIDAKKLEKAQVARMRAALAALRGQLDALEAELG